MLTAVPFVIAAVVVNVYPYDADSDTEMLVALHLPVVLWFAVAYPYMGGTIRSHQRRMDFVRFTGEWFIYYVLIALGGGVLMALTAGILEPTGVDVDRVAEWVLPSGAAGAVVVAAWLVESKQQVVENMAPVLTMIFTPLFAVMLACAAVVYAVTGLGDAFDRELVSIFDALLVVVLGARPVRHVRAGAVHVARMDGRHPAGRRRQRARARPGGSRRDGRPDRRCRVHPEPNGRVRAQPRPAREPGRAPPGCPPDSSRTKHVQPARALADVLPARLRPVDRGGRRRHTRRCSASVDGHAA